MRLEAACVPVDVEAMVLPGQEEEGEGGDDWVLGDGQEGQEEGLLLSGAGNDNVVRGSTSSSSSDGSIGASLVGAPVDSDDDEDEDGYVTALPDGGFAPPTAQEQGLASTPVFGGPNRLATQGNKGQGQGQGGGTDGQEMSGSTKYKKGNTASIIARLKSTLYQ